MKVKKDNTKHVLMISTSFPLRYNSVCGLFILQFALALQNYTRVSVICPADQSPVEEILAVPVYYAPKRWRRLYNTNGGVASHNSILVKSMVPFLFISMLIRALVIGRKSDAIVGHWSFSGVVAGVCGRLLGKPSAVFYRGSDINQIEHSFSLYLLFKLSASLCHHVFFVSESLRHKIKMSHPDIYQRSSTIENGISMIFYHNRPPQKQAPDIFKFLAVGSLISVKDYETLVFATELLVKRISNFSITIVGDGPLRGELETMCQIKGLQNHIKFIGNVPHEELPAYFRNADTLIHTSVAEGRSGVICEAICNGLPVARCNIEANASIFGNRCRELEFQPRDANALQEIMYNLAVGLDIYNKQLLEIEEIKMNLTKSWDDSASQCLRKMGIQTS